MFAYLHLVHSCLPYIEGNQRVLIENQLDLWQTWGERHNHQANNNSEKLHVNNSNLETDKKFEVPTATDVNDTFT